MQSLLPSNQTSYEDFAVLEGNIVMVNGQRFYHIYCSRDMGVMDSLVGQSTNLDDKQTTP